ncbi:unnamed protein product [Allacma fusca]|uniref:Uncharacterized protein n=1 Tax=Allacma fusca TaxID=39272 RepID=A0A8J2KJB7_9HEXA|nr:unnamed protein product [Allacma fusca]
MNPIVDVFWSAVGVIILVALLTLLYFCCKCYLCLPSDPREAAYISDSGDGNHGNNSSSSSRNSHPYRDSTRTSGGPNRSWSSSRTSAPGLTIENERRPRPGHNRDATGNSRNTSGNRSSEASRRTNYNSRNFGRVLTDISNTSRVTPPTLPGVHGRQGNDPRFKSISFVKPPDDYDVYPENLLEPDEFESLTNYLHPDEVYFDDPGWLYFKKRHVITLLKHPDHPEWNAQKWNDYIRKNGMSDRSVNSIISCMYENEIIEDFNPLDQTQFVAKKTKGAVYKSKNGHVIYHMLQDSTTKDVYRVYRDRDKQFVAAVRLMNDSGDNHAIFVPIHFQSRYQTAMFDVRKSHHVR